jgi:hypothetical protein
VKKESNDGASIAANLSRAGRSAQSVTAKKQHGGKARAARKEYFVPFVCFNFHL